jgi:hypothetical protein
MQGQIGDLTIHARAAMLCACLLGHLTPLQPSHWLVSEHRRSLVHDTQRLESFAPILNTGMGHTLQHKENKL